MSKENLFEPGKIRTYTGRYVDPFDMKLDDIDINDICHALSHIPRFGGHTRHFYSVAEHSMYCANMMPYMDKEIRLQALLHDASEAYLLDIPTPIKQRLPEYKKAEQHIMHLVSLKFGFDWPISEKVKEADERILRFEWDQLMVAPDAPKAQQQEEDINYLIPPTLREYQPNRVRDLFMSHFNEYHRNSN